MNIYRRCSATPVRLTPSSPLRFIAAGHAVVPWAFPGYFGESTAWLKFLDETHVRYYAEFREVRHSRGYETTTRANNPLNERLELAVKNGRTPPSLLRCFECFVPLEIVACNHGATRQWQKV